jgi:TatA/E family protein of Tat protein translocase
MGSLGMPEILIILVIALIVFGPRKLPELGKTLGKSLAQFRRASEDFKRQWEDEVLIERQRIDSPAPVDHLSQSTSAVVTPGVSEEIQPRASEEHSEIQTSSETPVAAHHEESAAQETKRDWM